MYIGDKKIKNIEEIDGKVKVVFEDDSKTTLSRKMYDISLSLDISDATQLQERRVVAVQGEVMKIFLDWDVKLVDLQKLIQWSANFIQQKHEFADEKLWGNNYLERTIGDLERVLTEKADTGDKI